MAYATGRITFVPNSRQDNQRDYSERSIIQLVDETFPYAVLRARDVEKNSQEIFSILLRRQDQYKYGRSADDPDEIRNDHGTFRLWLSEGSRKEHHKVMEVYFKQLALIDQSESPPAARSNERNDSNNNRRSEYVDDNRGYRTTDENREPRTTDFIRESRNDTRSNYRQESSGGARTGPSTISPKDLIKNVHLLGEYIEQGDVHEAVEKASQLASQRARIKRGTSENTRNDEEFSIQVQLDGNEFPADQHGATIPVTVFPSTTVRELRATFELTHHYRPTQQYFFVNGHLVHDHSTMKDLKVGPSSLFVLFYLKHGQTTAPWKCKGCQKDNPPGSFRCSSCSATP